MKPRFLQGSYLTVAATGLLMLTPGMAFASDVTGQEQVAVSQGEIITITGVVVDTTGEPIIGASIIEKGKTTGVVTNIDGEFSIKAPINSVLEVKYLGYKSQDVKAAPNLTITLHENNEVLSEVVVVGYGQQKKANLTGAVASIDVGAALDSRPISDVSRGLQGTTPGLSITVPSAEVGTDPNIRIRGQLASIEGNSTPLILLDNVEIPSLSLVNPDDIESITVLKDAAASSIYGSKAAFGVILINTKQGAKTDQITVSYSGNMAWQTTAKGSEVGGISAMEYIMEAAERGGANVAGGVTLYITREGIELAKQWDKLYGGKITSKDPMVYGRDWYVNSDGRPVGIRRYDPYDYLVKDVAPSTTHNLSVSGRSGKTSFNIGLGYLDQSGMNKAMKDDSFKRYNASVNITTEFNKYITLKAGMIYSKREKSYGYNSTGVYDPWYYCFRWSDIAPMGFDENGNELRSPALEFSQANTAKQIRNYTNVNLGVHLNLLEGWTADFDFTHANQEYNWLRPGTRFNGANTWWSGFSPRLNADGSHATVNYYDREMAAYDYNAHYYTDQGTNVDQIRRYSENSNRNTINAYTTYVMDINRMHNFKFMLGLNKVTYNMEYSEAQRYDVNNYDNPQFNFATGNQFAMGGKEWNSQLGYFGRINYDFEGKYLLEANLRYDGTSIFGRDNRWRWYPSFSGGWRVSEEKFMRSLQPVLSNLKLRASWGKIGDQTVSNSLYVSTVSMGSTGWIGADGKYTNFAGMPTTVAADITWQDIATFDVGVDARFFNGEFGASFDWYRRKTENMIVPNQDITHSFGTSSLKGNYGNLHTDGWELSLDFNHRFSNGINFNAVFALSDFKTIVDNYGNVNGINSYYPGKVYGEIWGFKVDRLYQKDDFVYDSNGNIVTEVVTSGLGAGQTVNKQKDPNAHNQGYLQSGSFIFGPGDVKYVDLDGDGEITRGSNTIDDHGDLTVIGNTTPRYQYSLRLGADWKGFDASVFFQGVGKCDQWGSSGLTLAGFNTGDGCIAKRFSTDYWTESNTDAFYPRPVNMSNGTNALNMCISDRYLLNMAYLRLKNVTLGYTLPMDLTRKIYIQKARLYFSAENLFTWDHLDGTPVDPEASTLGSTQSYEYLTNNGGSYAGGRVGIGTPAFKTFSVGVQLTF